MINEKLKFSTLILFFTKLQRFGHFDFDINICYKVFGYIDIKKT